MDAPLFHAGGRIDPTVREMSVRTDECLVTLGLSIADLVRLDAQELGQRIGEAILRSPVVAAELAEAERAAAERAAAAPAPEHSIQDLLEGRITWDDLPGPPAPARGPAEPDLVGVSAGASAWQNRGADR